MIPNDIQMTYRFPNNFCKENFPCATLDVFVWSVYVMIYYRSISWMDSSVYNLWNDLWITFKSKPEASGGAPGLLLVFCAWSAFSQRPVFLLERELSAFLGKNLSFFSSFCPSLLPVPPPPFESVLCPRMLCGW